MLPSNHSHLGNFGLPIDWDCLCYAPIPNKIPVLNQNKSPLVLSPRNQIKSNPLYLFNMKTKPKPNKFIFFSLRTKPYVIKFLVN